MKMCRGREIFADAAYIVFNRKAREFIGHSLIDDTFLVGEG